MLSAFIVGNAVEVAEPSGLSPRNYRALNEWMIEASPSEAWTLSGALVVVCPPTSAAPSRVFAAFAGSVVGVAALPAGFSCHQPSVAPLAGAPALVSAGASAVPGPASRAACPAVAGISGLAAGSLCWEQPSVPQAEGRQDDVRCWCGEARCSLDAERAYSPLVELRHAWREDGKARLLVWPIRRRGREMLPAWE